MEMDYAVYRGKKRTVKPAAPLRNELRNLIWHIGFRISRLNIVQDPRATPFWHELPTKNLNKEWGPGRNNIPYPLTRSSARYMFAVKMSAPAPCCNTKSKSGPAFVYSQNVPSFLRGSTFARGPHRSYHSATQCTDMRWKRQEERLCSRIPTHFADQEDYMIGAKGRHVQWLIQNVWHLVLEILGCDCMDV